MGTGNRNQSVAALSANVSTAQFAQFLSHVAAPRQSEPLDVAERLSLVSEHWSPKVVARLNNYETKLLELEGEFVWHTHEDTDELFLVVDGKLTIQLREGSVDLKPGQLFVVPRAWSIARSLRERFTSAPPTPDVFLLARGVGLVAGRHSSQSDTMSRWNFATCATSSP
jgi:homogentisate 1,2-dioxygenase